MVAEVDLEFVFGNPKGQLATRELARLTIMRGWVRDLSHLPANLRGQLRFGGDDADAPVLVGQIWSDDT